MTRRQLPTSPFLRRRTDRKTSKGQSKNMRKGNTHTILCVHNSFSYTHHNSFSIRRRNSLLCSTLSYVGYLFFSASRYGDVEWKGKRERAYWSAKTKAAARLRGPFLKSISHSSHLPVPFSALKRALNFYLNSKSDESLHIALGVRNWMKPIITPTACGL